MKRRARCMAVFTFVRWRSPHSLSGKDGAEGGLGQFRFGQSRQFESGKYCFPLSARASINLQRIGRLELFLNGRKSAHGPFAEVSLTSRLDNCPPTRFAIGNDGYCDALWAIVVAPHLLNNHPVQINAGNASWP